ncbi:MAG: AbrB/MazE/SpoVT family DNA-binding domain-containing protein [Candidatus Humimicrobiaceae bacterium]
MNKTKITRKGQVTIPKEIRDRLALKESDNLQVSIEGNSVVMEKLETFESLRGSVKMPQKYKNMSWEKLEKHAQEEHAKEVMDE